MNHDRHTGQLAGDSCVERARVVGVDDVDLVFADEPIEVEEKGEIERPGEAVQHAPVNPSRNQIFVENASSVETADIGLKPRTIQPFNEKLNDALQASEVEIKHDM
jgi:hypothetical protein